MTTKLLIGKQKISSVYIEFNNNDNIYIIPKEEYLLEFRARKKGR